MSESNDRAAYATGIRAGLLVAVAGSLWAAAYPAGCAVCGSDSGLFFGLNLGWLGLAFYGGLLAWHAWRPGSAWLALGLLAAAGAHLALGSLLIRLGAWCWPCILTALGAWAAAALACAAARPRWDWGLALGSAAVLATLGAYAFGLEHERGRQQALAEPLLAALRDEAPEGRWLVVFEREGCVHCETFKDEFVPEIIEAYPEGVEVETREAPEGVWAPVVAALGPGGAAIHPGLPTPGMLWSFLPGVFGPPDFPE